MLSRLDVAARELGLDMLAAVSDTALPGPDSGDIAAAASISKRERADMIRGMVAGLAARLEENPGNPEGWIMLIRSYAVLGMTRKAHATYAEARRHFTGDAAILERLKAQAEEVLGGN